MYFVEQRQTNSNYTIFFFQIVMFCLKEPDSFCGGETVLLKSKDLTATLDPNVIQKFETKKVRYQAFLPNKNTEAGLQKSWQDRFWLDDPKVCLKVLIFFFSDLYFSIIIIYLTI